tara:strand:- start:185 stop:487 length:303 start_codon:yes stop_codon:yes gene_type:complete
VLESVLIVLVAIIEVFVIIWGLSQINRSIREEIEDLEEKIDQKLALAIQSTGLVQTGEPINPIQAAIANMLTSAANNSNANKQPIEILRDSKGNFTKKDE